MSQPVSYPRVAALKTAPQFLARLAELGVALPFDEQVASGDGSPLAQPTEAGGLAPRNRFCILPMEGWDGTADGRPTDLTRRRWGSFGRSGAKLIWGGEAVAVRHDGRANPNQLALGAARRRRPRRRCATHLVEEHAARDRRGPMAWSIGLQLTHSGRYARPNPGGRWEPIAAYAHPLLDRRFPAGTPVRTFTDDELDALVGDFVRAAVAGARRRLRLRRRQALPRLPGARAAQRAGSRRAPTAARSRTAPGSCASIVEGIRRDAPGLGDRRPRCRPSTPCRSARTRAASACRKRTWRRTANAFGLLADGDSTPRSPSRPRAPARARGARRPLDLA